MAEEQQESPAVEALEPASLELPAVEPAAEPVAEPLPAPAEVPGWPGIVPETPEAHDARRKVEAEAAEAVAGA